MNYCGQVTVKAFTSGF